MIPELMTQRLRLRAPTKGDWPAYRDVLVSDRARYMDGPYELDDAWNDFHAVIGGWSCDGFGGLSVERRSDGAYVGTVAIGKPPSFPEIELGWLLTEAAEGKGYGTEAASALRDYGFAVLGLPTLVSYVDVDNVRSRRLAERLGAVVDPAAATPDDGPCLVYRHTRPDGGAGARPPTPPPPPSSAPVLITDRMVLRQPRQRDADDYIAVLMSDRARHIGGPMNRYDAWLDFRQETASWVLNDYGGFAMEDRATGAFLGLIVLNHADGDPERELGFVLTEAAEGRGLAGEAARAVLDWAFARFDWDSLVSYVDPANARSAALVERLGARIDPEAELPRDYPGVLIYRHRNPRRAP